MLTIDAETTVIHFDDLLVELCKNKSKVINHIIIRTFQGFYARKGNLKQPPKMTEHKAREYK